MTVQNTRQAKVEQLLEMMQDLADAIEGASSDADKAFSHAEDLATAVESMKEQIADCQLLLQELTAPTL